MIVKTEKDMKFVQHNFTPVKRKLLNKYSNAEEHFETLLKKTSMFYIREKGNFRYETRWCYYDFFIPFYRIYVEIDGKSHESVAQKTIDKEKHGIVDHKKRFLVRLTNEEVLGLEEISLCYLVKRLCEQANLYNSFFFDFTIDAYIRNVYENELKAIRDMLSDTNIKVDMDKNVFMYCKSTGRIYRFLNECIVKIILDWRLVKIRELLVDTDYKKRSSRKYVLAYSEEECIRRVKKCMGLDIEYNGNIKLSCGVVSLLPIMNDMEREKWFGIGLSKT